MPRQIQSTTTDLVGAGASAVGGMVKGHTGKWEERTDGIMQIMCTIRLNVRVTFHPFSFKWCGATLFYTSPQWMTRNVLRQCTSPILFASPVPARSTTLRHQCATHCYCRQNTLDNGCIIVRRWDSWGKIVVQSIRRGAWRRDPSSADPGIDSDSDSGAGQCTSPSCGTKP